MAAILLKVAAFKGLFAKRKDRILKVKNALAEIITICNKGPAVCHNLLLNRG